MIRVFARSTTVSNGDCNSGKTFYEMYGKGPNKPIVPVQFVSEEFRLGSESEMFEIP